MVTLERKRPSGRAMENRFAKITQEELDLLPETDYTVSDATVAEWDELVRETQEKLRSGKIIPKTAAEWAAEYGINLEEAQ